MNKLKKTIRNGTLMTGRLWRKLKGDIERLYKTLIMYPDIETSKPVGH